MYIIIIVVVIVAVVIVISVVVVLYHNILISVITAGYMEVLDNKWILLSDTKCPERDASPATLGLTNMAGKSSVK